MNVIETDNLTKYYVDTSFRGKKRTKGIENVTFNVHKGEVFGFLGPNGAGKTTTIRLLLDLIRPTSGSAKVLGLDVKKNSEKIRAKIGYIPGEINFYNNLTAKYHLNYYEKLQGDEAPLMDELIKYFDIPLDRPVKTFSRGMKQKLAIIQGFMHDPELIIMDEPTAGLDPLVQLRFYEFLLKQKKLGKTVFISTHILSEAERVCDRVAIIREGELVDIEDVSSLRSKSGRSISVSFEEAVSEKDIMTDEIVSITNINGGFNIQTGKSITKTLQKISSHTIKDIKISEPSLEDIFMQYYSGDKNV